MRAAFTRFTVVAAIVSALAATTAGAAADDAARAAATAFGQALIGENAAALRPILPEHGRVHLTLNRLGPEEGLFGARQVEALFRDFFNDGRVASFELGRCDSGGGRSALVHGKAAVTGRDGRTGRVGLHLAFELEGSRWVLREVKETAE